MRSGTKNVGLLGVVGVAAIFAACSSTKGDTGGGTGEDAYSEDTLTGGGAIGAHEILPRAERLALAERLGNDVQVAEVRTTDNGARIVCGNSLDDVNCYADACALELGGNDIAKNYLPEGIDPRKDSVDVDGTKVPIETVKTVWNGKEIKWEEVDGRWQYTFDGKPGAEDWPEKGAGLRAPVTSASSLRCDWYEGSSQSCVPTQKRMDFVRNGVRWVILFRRSAPLQPGVADSDPRSDTQWGNIAIVGYRETETKNGDEAQNAVCWFNTFNKTNLGRQKVFPLPVPGGRFGTTAEETARRKRAVDFWDTPQEHRTLTVNFGPRSQLEGNNCIYCHGNGPNLDVAWFREKKGSPNDDDTLAFFSTGGLHNHRTFFTLPDNKCAGGCHTYWAKGTQTCDDTLLRYTSSEVDGASRKRNGWTNIDPDATGAASQPAEDERPARSLIMPDPVPSRVKTIGDYKKEFGEAIAEIRACCTGTSTKCGTEVVAQPPKYYGEHEDVPTVAYRQKIKGPKAADTLVARGNENCTAKNGACDVEIAWNDPTGAYDAPETWRIESGATTAAFCAGGAEAKAKATSISGFRSAYKETVSIPCGETREVRVCGEYGSASRASRETGTTISVRATCN